MHINSFDYAIVGTGAAGFQLILKMLDHPTFRTKKILLIDKLPKTKNDRTWSFWEESDSKWNSIITKKWKQGEFIGKEHITLDLSPFEYKTIRSFDFYEYAKAKIREHENVTQALGEVENIRNNIIYSAGREFKAKHIFDSRIDPQFEENKNSYTTLIQHFKGWFIETETPVFNPERFTMMDYRLKWNQSTSFTYVLPFTPTKALVEFTLFNQEMLSDSQYDEKLETYIRDYLGIKNYKIEEVEKGEIPMSDYPFHRHNEHNITKIGTAGGWVRPSSGYSFKNSDRYTSQILENLLAGRRADHKIANNRFRKYDAIFLKVLEDYNERGEEVFSSLYLKQPINRVLRFLDEQSSIADDVKIMASLNHPSFRKAFFAKL